MSNFEQQRRISPTCKKIPRRSLFQMAGAGTVGTVLALGCDLGRCEELSLPRPTDPSPPLGPGERIELTQAASTAIVQKTTQLAAEYLQQYGGCAQCTLAALQDALPFLPADPGLFRAASCLDGGATPSQLHQCGGFTAAGLTIGYLCGRTRDEIFFGDRSLARQLLQKVFAQFQNHYGGVLCKEVRGKVNGNCRLSVSRAAQWTAETLLEAFAGYKIPSVPELPPIKGKEKR
ncbi:MAG TPA: C-GCAxxG-C-C family protein [Thermoguttaceae bacterium]|nr:C-GCAxxG-C-C family protein [Thermoguttaceae bacterium]